MRYLSVCSGIEAASVAWEPLKWQPVAFAEIEPFPSAVLAHRFPGVPNWGDMTKFKEWPDADVDVLVGGTPCQSFSVAGLRKGLADPRGNLMLTYLAIADRYRPRWLVWENVPGVLSSEGGRDFGTFLGALGQLGYGFAYRVLDAQFVRTCSHPFAVPQRRRRVFVVGCLGGWQRAAAVLFDGESLRGHPPPRRKAGQRPAGSLAAGTTGGRLTDLAPTMDARAKDGPRLNQLGVGVLIPHGPPVSPALKARDAKGPSSDGDGDGAPLLAVAHSLRGEGFDASEDGTGRGTPLVPIDMRQASRGATMTNNRAEGSSGGAPGTGIGEVGDPSPTIAGSHVPAIAGPLVPVAFDCKDTEVQFAVDGSHPTLRSMGHNHSHQNAGGHAAVALPIVMMERGRADGPSLETRQDGAANTILTPNGGRSGLGVGAVAFDLAQITSAANQTRVSADLPASTLNSAGQMHVAQPWAVRRLTPTECERLQGFPDGWTDIPWRGKPTAPDGPRYKALGNSMAVNVMNWLGERIALVEGIE